MTAALVLWCPPDPGVTQNSLVTAVDLDRAARFRQPVDAHRHLTGRVLARRAAAAWLALAPDEVQIDVEPAGRPVVIDGAGDRLGAHLSITHAGHLVGVTVADRPVGIDVQDVSALAEVLESPDIWTRTELDDLAGLDPDERLRTAAQWWTAKEAVLKSLGRGLLDPVDLLEARDSPVPWSGLDIDEAHAAAIAGAAPDRVLRLAGLDEPIAW